MEHQRALHKTGKPLFSNREGPGKFQANYEKGDGSFWPDKEGGLERGFTVLAEEAMGC